MTDRTVCLSIDDVSDSELPRVMEVIGRAAAGLILEGLEARIYTYEDDDAPGR